MTSFLINQIYFYPKIIPQFFTLHAHTYIRTWHVSVLWLPVKRRPFRNYFQPAIRICSDSVRVPVHYFRNFHFAYVDLLDGLACPRHIYIERGRALGK